MGEFIKHVLKERDQFRRTVGLAHNASLYDSILAARTEIEEQGLGKDMHMIVQGNKIIQKTLGKQVVFRDAHAYMGVKLARTLGLDTNLRKGEFPYLFNTVENQNYTGPIPPFAMFDAEGRRKEEYDALKQWHDECSQGDDYTFDMKKETTF